MIRSSSISTLSVAAFAAMLILAPLTASAEQPASVDLTAKFVQAGIDISRLEVTEVGGIVVIRGRAVDRAAAETAGAYARSLGYARVANLVQVIEPPDDAKIQRVAERELTIHRSLDGCRFHVETAKGVVTVGGIVRHELQKDVALALLRNIDGVQGVRSSLVRD